MWLFGFLEGLSAVWEQTQLDTVTLAAYSLIFRSLTLAKTRYFALTSAVIDQAFRT